jgi:hypothetical protein
MFGLSKILNETKKTGSSLIDRLNNSQKAYQLMDLINDYHKCITDKTIDNSKGHEINPKEGKIITREYTLVEI